MVAINALHVLLYRAFGWEAPNCSFIIVKPVGNGKLSKRDGDKIFCVFPWIGNRRRFQVTEKRIFPEAVINFLALLVGNGQKNYSHWKN
jgi:glutamyl-tRNA synthetase